MKAFLTAALLSGAVLGHAQTTLTGTQALTTCAGVVYDSGNANNYVDVNSGTLVLTPAQPNSLVRVYTEEFRTERDYDFLYVFDGPTIKSPLLATWHGEVNASVISTNANGSLTLFAQSDLTINYSGFKLRINCVPSDYTALFYKDCSFGGPVVNLPAGSYTKADLTAKGIADNDVSAIEVRPGYEIEVFDNDNFSGSSLIVQANDDCLVNENFNNKATSLIVRRTGQATVYKHCAYAGSEASLKPGDYSLAALQSKGILDNDISSLRVAPGYAVDLFDSDNFQGSAVTITADNSCLSSNGWNDQATSLRVRAVAATGTTTIEAENYGAMQGVQTEATADAGGGQDVGWIDNGDWLAYYNVVFPTSGAYTVEYRVASVSGGRLSSDLKGGTIPLGTIDVPATGDWQKWATVRQTINVNAGTYNLGVFAVVGGWNLNWIKITKANAAAKASPGPTAALSTSGFELYPNPAQDRISILSPVDLAGGTISIKNVQGVEVLRKTATTPDIDVSGLAPGIYSLTVTKQGKTYTKRFIK